jgi:glycosyltransferase involved in cell wall biosynthesis
MRIHIPYISDQNIGGGYTFYRNFVKGLEQTGADIKIVPENEDYEVLFAFSPTTVNGETVERAKKKGAKFLLRMDGVPEDSRNSGKGTRRMVEYSLAADHIVYQSDFIKNTVGLMLRNNGVVSPHSTIRNGVDLDIFTPAGSKIAFPGDPKILHIAYRKDNNKRYEEVVAMYREFYPHYKNSNLLLLGRYPTEWQDYSMGFFNGEKYQRLGIMTDDAVKAQMIRSADLFFYPSFADPAPNVVMETLACGIPILYCPYGGAKEVIGDGGIAIDYNKTYTEQIEAMIANLPALKAKARAAAENYSLKSMVAKYIETFNTL